MIVIVLMVKLTIPMLQDLLKDVNMDLTLLLKEGDLTVLPNGIIVIMKSIFLLIKMVTMNIQVGGMLLPMKFFGLFLTTFQKIKYTFTVEKQMFLWNLHQQKLVFLFMDHLLNLIEHMIMVIAFLMFLLMLLGVEVGYCMF